MNEIHKLYQVKSWPSHSSYEREMIVETAHSEPKEIHIGCWPLGEPDVEGTYVALTPEQALELGENIVRRALAAMIDNEYA